MNYKKSLIIFVAAMMGMMDIAVSQNRTYSVNGVEFVMVEVDGGN